jgi:hypothetical protein
MSSTRKKTKAKKVKAELPDLTEIFYAFTDAHALVAVACESIMHNNNPGRAACVLYLGVEALERVSDQLEKADMQLEYLRRKKESARGAS